VSVSFLSFIPFSYNAGPTVVPSLIGLHLHRLWHPMDITPAPTVVPSLIGLKLHHPHYCYIKFGLVLALFSSFFLSPHDHAYWQGCDPRTIEP